jgi:acyl carrier protein
LIQCGLNHQDKILEIIRKIAQKDVSPPPSESLFDSGILDSFALPDMVGELEKEFGIRVPDSDLNPRKFESIERIEQYVASRA